MRKIDIISLVPSHVYVKSYPTSYGYFDLMSLQPELPGNKLREALIHQIGIGIDFMIDGQEFPGQWPFI